jgi:hypothetical protein
MISIGKRAACIGAVVALVAAAAPVASADTPSAAQAAPAPLWQPTGPVAGAFQAGANAMIFGWNAGTDAAVFGLNAGGAALGVPFQLTVQTPGPGGVHVVGWAPIVTTP